MGELAFNLFSPAITWQKWQTINYIEHVRLVNLKGSKRVSLVSKLSFICLIQGDPRSTNRSCAIM